MAGGKRQITNIGKILITILLPRFVSDLMRATPTHSGPIADAGAVSATAPAQICKCFSEGVLSQQGGCGRVMKSQSGWMGNKMKGSFRSERDSDVKAIEVPLGSVIKTTVLSCMLVLGTAVAKPASCYAQAQSQKLSPGESADSGSSSQPAATSPVVSSGQPADVTRGEVRGFIQDEAGVPIPGALVTIHAIGDGSDQRVASVGLGAFTVEGLKPGKYQMTATKAGFASSKTSTIEVTADQSLRVNFTLVASTAILPSQPITYSARRELVSASAPAAAPEANAFAASAGGLTSSGQPSSSAQPPPLPAEVQQQLLAMMKRIEDLEEALKERDASTANAAATPLQIQVQPPADSSSSATPAPTVFAPQTQTKSDPFSKNDWTWMNSVSRNKDTPLATKYFTPEVRFDANYIEDYNQPKDHTMGGSTESFRNGEFQLEQVSFGGDIRVDNVRGRILTMAGLFSTTTPRNDGSYGVGQWDLRGAYKYFSEAWGGYHFNVNHGLNIDAGIFVSYIGLFSYYNFDNWTYQPSFVSSNTPWFFNGVRIQWFPKENLKIEPWIINGWQSYAKFNGHIGLGGQILWRPKPYLSIVANNYGMGTDTLGVPGRSRIHTDDSVEVKYFDHPDGRTALGIDKMAFTVTGDAGCEYGGGVSCHNDSNGHPKQMFLGWMLYDRTWFHKDLFAMTLGGGAMNNPGRYLVLLPPINGADAVSGSPYFQGYPGSKYKGWDGTVTFDYMPSQFITFRFETGYRYANVPYWSGHGGITPPGANYTVPNTKPGDFVCSTGADSGIGAGGINPAVNNSGNIAYDANIGAAETACGTPGSLAGVWQPDLRKSQWANTIAIMVKW